MILKFEKNIDKEIAKAIENSHVYAFTEEIKENCYKVTYTDKGGLSRAKMCARFLNRENEVGDVMIDLIVGTLHYNPEGTVLIPVRASAIISKYLTLMVEDIEGMTDKNLCPSEEIIQQLKNAHVVSLLELEMPGKELKPSFWRTIMQMSGVAWFLNHAVENNTDVIITI
jgi:hypothetical protein